MKTMLTMERAFSTVIIIFLGALLLGVCLDRPLPDLTPFAISSDVGVKGQTLVVAPEGGTATITDLTLPSSSGSVTTEAGKRLLTIDFFSSPTVEAEFQTRVTVSNFSPSFQNARLTMTIRNVQRTDAGNFKCVDQFQRSAPNCPSGHRLVVASKPTKPVLRVVTEPVVVGGDVILECSSSSTSVPKVTELRLVYNLKENGRLALAQPTESSRFRIPAVTKSRSGYRYTCVATEKNSVDNTLTGVQSDDSNEYILNPKYGPDRALLNPSNTSYSINTNSLIPVVTCSADCNPPCDINWYKGTAITQTGPQLNLGSADKSKAGNYFCRVENTQGKKESPVSITVTDQLGNTRLTPDTSQYTVPTGTSLPDIVCQADCTPACTYTWARDGQALGVATQTLRLGSVTPSISGRYTCTASNGADSSSVSFTLDVQYPPSVPASGDFISPATKSYRAEEGAVVLPDITCSASCNPSCTVMWTKNNLNYKPGPILSLGTAQRDDTGSYKCTASNGLGNTSVVVDVQIEYRPNSATLTPSSTLYTVVSGADVIPEVTCSADCNPACQFQWFKGGAPDPIKQGASLTLGAAAGEKAGTYRCRAWNRLGEVNKEMGVSVLHGPLSVTLDPARDKVAVPAGELLPTITCSAVCNPGCSYSWVKDDASEPLTRGRTLTLDRVTQNSAGIYKCVATNPHGTANNKFELAVQFGPSSTITFSPAKDVHDVAEGGNLTVTCSATCDPPCSYRWRNSTGQTVAGDATLRLTTLRTENSGKYTCVADNKIGTPAERSLQVNTLVGPVGRMNISPSGPTVTLKQGNSVVLSCSAGCSPSCTYLWTKGAQVLSSANGILTLNDVGRQQDGVYTCQATNSAGEGTKKISLEVQYGPGDSITFNPDKTSHTVQENVNLTVTCAADCKPACDFRWTKQGAAVATGAVLSLPVVKREQAGDYRCLADNVVQAPSSRVVTVAVLYGPSDVTLFPDVTDLYPTRGSNVSVKCSATCNPSCTYTWYKGARIVPSTNGVLMLSSLSTLDSGQYECKAANSIDPSTSRFINILVKAGPGTSIRFNPPEDSVFVVEGRQLVVDCIAECSPACTYVWKKGTRQVAQGPTLRFSTITREDAGGYSCFASNDADNQASKPLQVDVQYGPGRSVLLFPPGTNSTYYRFQEGSPYNIKCSADCHPPCTYRWFYGSRLEPQYTSGVLFSDSATLNATGSYSCQATNGVGTGSSYDVYIDIHTGPGSTLTFRPEGNRQVVREGGDLLVTCSADCSPPCSYRWKFGTEELTTAGGRLDLPVISRNQSGLYTCIAQNGNGNQGTRQLSVDVQYGPGATISLFPSNSTQTLNEGASMSIKCSADCSPKCVYVWSRGSAKLTVSSTDGVLTLVTVGPEDAGNYRCTARNSIGLEATTEVTVVVQTGPGNTVKIEPSLAVYEISEGTDLQMKCSATCSPSCTYTWYFDFERVKARDGVLLKPNVSRTDSGPYICYAANDVGIQGSNQIKVDVVYGPGDSIQLDPENALQIEAGNPFSLRCSADCRPPCSYVWSLGGQIKSSEGGKLNIGKASEADAGNYTCRASNKLGATSSKPLTVEVNYGPGSSIALNPAPDPALVISEGSDLTVTCSARCRPACSYSWYEGIKRMTSGDGVLFIPGFNRTHPRYYTCVADNGGSKATAVLQVEVNYGPGDKANLFPNASTITAPVGESLSVQCSADCSPPCHYTWTRSGVHIQEDSLGVLLLKNLQPEAKGAYVCSASNMMGKAATASVDIQLLSGPGASIRFTPPGLTRRVAEGETFNVTCDGDCLPACQLSWLRDGNVVSKEGLLQLKTVKRADKGVYQCNAVNSLGVNVTQHLSLDVTYGPSGSVELFPPERSRELMQGETLSVKCSATCSPQCSVQWSKEDKVLSGKEGVLLLSNIESDDSGVYTCTAGNGVGIDNAVNLTVHVNFGPENSMMFQPPDLFPSVVEGQTLQVRCSAHCLPACSYTWHYGGDGSSKVVSRDGLLSLPAVTRQDAGTYTCHADNGVGRRVTQDLQLAVRFPPNLPTFDPASTSYTIRERIDSVSDIRCYVDCNPRCNITWLKDGQSLNISGNVLALTTPDRQADGVYTCRASNDLGEREKNVTINVNYAPSITYFTINERRASSVARENDPVTLNCRVSSMPPSSIQIYNGSTLISAMTSTLQAKYSWQNAKCLDSGMYTCKADNGVGPLVSVVAELRVHCVPRLDPRVFKLPFVAANLGDTAVIHIPVIGEPTPSFQWYRVHGGVPSEPLAAKDQRGQSDKFFVSTPSSSTLTIQNVQVADYGDYLVTMDNNIGTSNYTFSVVPKSAPYRASQLTARPIDAHAVEVTWSPGFNGGARQQFSLEYLKDGTNGWRALALDPTIEDMTTSLSVNVSDLNPATAYTFRIRSRNTYGYSDYSNTARVVTDAAPDGLVATGNVNTLPVLLGVGLAVGFLVGAGITAIVVVSRCRPRARKDESPIDDARSDTTYDTLYLRDALWAQHHIKLRSNTGSTRSRFDDMDGYDYKQPENKI